MNEAAKQVRTGVDIDIELIDSRGDRESMHIVIARRDVADVDSGVLAAGAPLAKAILGKRVGAEVPYRRGDIVAVRIVHVGEPAAAPVDAAAQDTARRQETVKKAVDDAERTNAAIFAASFTSKWGGYDAGDPIDWADKDKTREDDNGQT